MTFQELMKQAIDKDGNIDLRKLNGPNLHDVIEGPCKCGAWHQKNDFLEDNDER